MENNVVFTAMIEVLGKPEKHVTDSIKQYIENLKNDEMFEVVSVDFADVKKQDEQELWAGFAEVEVKTAKIEDLTQFCFKYMPSMIEITEPKKVEFSDGELTNFLNDLQSRLHQVDMVARTMRAENETLRKNGGSLLKNYITVLLSRENMDAGQLSQLTGVVEDKLADFLDQLIDEGRIDLKEDIYFVPSIK